MAREPVDRSANACGTRHLCTKSWRVRMVAHQTGPLGVSSLSLRLQLVRLQTPTRPNLVVRTSQWPLLINSTRHATRNSPRPVPLSAPPALPATAPIEPFKGLTDPLLYEVEGNWEDIDEYCKKLIHNCSQGDGQTVCYTRLPLERSARYDRLGPRRTVYIGFLGRILSNLRCKAKAFYK
jgi:hypothetical protein